MVESMSVLLSNTISYTCWWYMRRNRQSACHRKLARTGHVNKILISSNNTQENKKKWITEKLHNIMLSLIIMTMIRRGGDLQVEWGENTTLLKHNILIVACEEIGHQRINISYIKVDSLMTDLYGYNFLCFSPTISNYQNTLCKSW